MRKIYTLIQLSFISLTLNAQTFQWAKNEGKWAYDYGYGIVNDDSGNVYVCGKYEDSAHFSGVILPNQGNHDIFLAKYSPSGTLLWIRTAGGVMGDYATAMSTDGSYLYIAGEIQGYNLPIYFIGTSTTLTNKGSNDVFIAKYDLNGNLIWAKQAGWKLNERASAITNDGNGNIYISGFFTDTTRFGGTQYIGYGGKDIFIAKFDSSGNFVWFRKEGGKLRDEGKAIQCDSSGNIYLCGMFEDTAMFGNQTLISPNDFFDVFLAKYAPSGSLIWVKTFGALYDDVGWGLAIDNANRIIMAGEFNAYVYFDGIPLETSGEAEVFVTCFNSSGDIQWAKSAGGGLIDRARGIGTDGNNIFITGQFGSTATFGSFTLTAADSSDIFFAAMDSMGNFKWATSVGGIPDPFESLGYESGIEICPDLFGNIYATGALLENGIFGGTTLSTWSRTDAFITKITQPCTSAPPQPGNISGLNAVCQGTANIFSIYPVSSATSYTWTVPSGWSGTSPSTSITITPGSVGGNINVSAMNACGSSLPQTLYVAIAQPPTIADAGPDQNICSATAALAANTPSEGSGMWSVISGTVSISTPSSPITGLTGIAAGNNILRWTISSSGCTPSTDDVVIARLDSASAGPDQNICSDATTLAANTPSGGSGLWSLISGTASITDPSSPTTGLTGIAFGTSTLQWTVNIVGCLSTMDTVVIHRVANVSSASAGPDQDICTTNTALSGNNPTVGIGKWSLVSGTATIITPSNPLSMVSEIGTGLNTLRWTITDEGCDTSANDVRIVRNASPTVSITSDFDIICMDEEIVLNANGASYYLWLAEGDTSENLLVSPESTTMYTLVGTDINGCSDTDKFTLIVKICVGISETISNEQIQIYPNPGKNEFKITGTKLPAEIKIYNSAGALVASRKIGEENLILEISAGIYFIEFNDHKKTRKKIIIQQ